MPIQVRRVDGGYEVDVTPPHGKGRPWRSPHPMSVDDLIAALLERGCHQTDIGDAFYEADPEWVSRKRPGMTVELRGDPNPHAIGWTADDAVMADLRSWLVERGFVVVRDHYDFESFGNQEIILTRPIAVRLVRDRDEWRVDVLGDDGRWSGIQRLREELRGPGPHLLSATDQADIVREILDEAEHRTGQ